MNRTILIILGISLVCMIVFVIYLNFNRNQDTVVGIPQAQNVQPENSQNGNVQPENNQSGNVQPEDYQNGNAQSEDYQNGNAQPEATPFLFPIEGVHTLPGGTVVTGTVERGSVTAGDEIEIIGFGVKRRTTVLRIETNEVVPIAVAGDSVGIFLTGISPDELERGQVLAEPDSIGLHTEFRASVYALRREEGGRDTPLSENEILQFYFRTNDVPGTITLLSEADEVSLGETAYVTVELDRSVALEIDTIFAIREDGRTIGQGTILEIIE